jgi:hypothetical protein
MICSRKQLLRKSKLVCGSKTIRWWKLTSKELLIYLCALKAVRSLMAGSILHSDNILCIAQAVTPTENDDKKKENIRINL